MTWRLAVFLHFFILSWDVFALSGVTVQGRLLRSDSSPVTSPQLQFKIQIRSPGNENCLLYEETQIKDLSSSDGNFSFIVQDALESSRVRTDTTGLSLEKIFANRVAFTGLSCGSGTSYTPSATDARVLQVLFREDVSSAWEPMPAQRVSAVPVALQALQIDGYTSSQLLRVADGSTLTELTAGDATNLSTLIAGTSASFVKPADLPACNANEYLTKSGSTVSCAPVSGSSGGTVTSVATGTGLTGGPIVSSGTIALANIASHTLLGNATGGATAPSATSLTSMLDASMGSAQGSVLYRDASGWTVLAPGTSGYFLKTQGASANPVWASASSGSVSSVDLSAPSIFSVAGNPITTSGTIALSLANQSANTVFAGPASGGAAAPSFRALNIPDLRSSVAGAFLTGSGCTAGQGLVYSSVNDNISCQDIAVTSSQVTTGLGYTPVNKAGDTMSGALNLPSNGLAVGTNQLVVSGGSLGIGTASPSTLVHAYSSAASTGIVSTNASSTGAGYFSAVGEAADQFLVVRHENSATANSGLGTIPLSGVIHTGAGDTGGLILISQAAAPLIFATGGVATSNERMRIDSAGNVGIGTTSPGTRLAVDGGDIRVQGSQYPGIDVITNNTVGDARLNLEGSTTTNGQITSYINFANRISGSAVVGAMVSGRRGVANDDGALSFSTKASGSAIAERVRIETSGNVGIGTAAPSVLLNVAGSDSWSSEVRLENQSSTSFISPSFSAYNWASTFGGYPAVGLFNARGSKASPAAVQAEDTLGLFAAYGYDGSSNGFGGAVALVAAENFTSTAHGSYLSFSTVGIGTVDSNERMVIDANGNVGIDNATPDARLSIQKRDGTAASIGIYDGTSSMEMGLNGNGAAFFYLYDANEMIFATANTERLRIGLDGKVGIGTDNPNHLLDVNGDVNIAAGQALRFAGTSVCTSAGCTSSSDRSLKENIRPLQGSLDKVLQLQGVAYNYKDGERYTLRPQVGVIAQDVEKVYPEVVTQDPETGLRAVAYDHLVAPLIEAVKEIVRKLDEKDLRIQALERENALQSKELETIKSRLDQLEKRLPAADSSR